MYVRHRALNIYFRSFHVALCGLFFQKGELIIGGFISFRSKIILTTIQDTATVNNSVNITTTNSTPYRQEERQVRVRNS